MLPPQGRLQHSVTVCALSICLEEKHIPGLESESCVLVRHKITHKPLLV